MSLPIRTSKSHRGRGKRNRLYPLFLLLAGFFLLLLALGRLSLNKGGRSIRPEAVDEAIDSVLVRYGVDKEKVASFWGEGGIKKERIRISDVYSLLHFHQSLNHLLQGSGARIIEGAELNRGKSLSLRVGFGERITHILLVERDPLVAARSAKLALILQDFEGRKGALLTKILRSNLPLALSFLPGTEQKNLRRAQKSGKEVLIALPLQSFPLPGMRRWEVRTDMEPDQIRGRVRKVLDYFPQAGGLDLSFGSEADQDLLLAIMQELGGRYLVVSHQIKDKSLTGRPMAVFSEDFIDKRERKEYILGKLRRLAHLAWVQGEAVGVGRLSAETWKVIKEERPRLEGKGIRFVPISQLLK